LLLNLFFIIGYVCQRKFFSFSPVDVVGVDIFYCFFSTFLIYLKSPITWPAFKNKWKP
jgi:hypothetical protein